MIDLANFSVNDKIRCVKSWNMDPYYCERRGEYPEFLSFYSTTYVMLLLEYDKKMFDILFFILIGIVMHLPFENEGITNAR